MTVATNLKDRNYCNVIMIAMATIQKPGKVYRVNNSTNTWVYIDTSGFTIASFKRWVLLFYRL